MQAVFLLALVAFAALCIAQNHPENPCKIDADCNERCGNSSTGVCSPATPQNPQPHCHCHEKEVSCKIDDDCKAACGSSPGCCHNADHCHCDEPCHHHPHH